MWPIQSNMVWSGLLQKKLADPWTKPAALLLLMGNWGTERENDHPEITQSAKGQMGTLWFPVRALFNYYHIKAPKKHLGLSWQWPLGPWSFCTFFSQQHLLTHRPDLGFKNEPAASATSRRQPRLTKVIPKGTVSSGRTKTPNPIILLYYPSTPTQKKEMGQKGLNWFW